MTNQNQAVANGTASATDLLNLMLSDRLLAQSNETLLSSLSLSNRNGLPRSCSDTTVA